MTTLLTRCQKVSPVLLVMADTKGNCSGVFSGMPLSESLKYSDICGDLPVGRLGSQGHTEPDICVPLVMDESILYVDESG